MRSANDTNRLAVDIAGEGITDARKSGERQLRAYLGITEMWLNQKTNTDPISYSIRLVNFGETPAFSVSASMTRRVMPFPLPDDFEMREDSDHDNYRSYVTVQPKGTVDITSSRNDPQISDATLHAAFDSQDGAADQTQIYCFGTLRFRDVFGRPHWAHYCKSFGGNYYRRTNGKPTTSNLYNDSSDDPEPGSGNWPR
jgi:hypothetical protein